MDLIRQAQNNGQRALSEFHSKRVLKAYGIPVTREFLVQTAEEAVDAADRIGYPVAVKACAWELMHKSDLGCVELGLADADAVARAFRRIEDRVRMPLEGILIQEMVAGSRELVAGLNRDPQFGACVMLGFGGTMAEVVDDTVFRIAPFDGAEAMDMIGDLRSRAMLEAFRGQSPADLEALSNVLMGLGELGLARDTVSEIDINPLIVSPEGRICAADALIVLEGGRP